LSVLALGGTILIWHTAKPGWMYALAAVLYVVSLLGIALSRRDARAAGLRSSTTDDK